eukprot:gene875-170_t
MAAWPVAERSKEAHMRWNSLSSEEKLSWKKKAEGQNNVEPGNLPDCSKKKLAEASIRRLTHELEFLSKLGWSGYYMVINRQESEVKYLADPNSTQFLVDNAEICENFLKFHGKKSKFRDILICFAFISF